MKLEYKMLGTETEKWMCLVTLGRVGVQLIQWEGNKGCCNNSYS